ncbi:hypothetical protein GOFOIKOB_1738 [Methylobacterium tardum]|nr:DUF4267 domain-containing protein [Methylobacterium tardum]URD39642.1 DUF4267 domain-containing protein [Methylobacterium tardum]GJE48706.1 hypothetical protein GOFOIKOB_1738 [Methylobacterium tardum]
MALAAVFLCLGGLFIVSPSAGAAIFGIPAPSGVPAGYLRAIGFRDVALALYLAGLACFSTRRAVCLVLMASVFIPFCDVILVWMSDSATFWQIALHGVSGAGLVLIAALISLSAKRA